MISRRAILSIDVTFETSLSKLISQHISMAVPALPSVFILPKGVRRSRERATSRSC